MHATGPRFGKFLYHLTFVPYHRDGITMELGLVDVVITEATMAVSISQA